jgi:hypothetical protein
MKLGCRVVGLAASVLVATSACGSAAQAQTAPPAIVSAWLVNANGAVSPVFHAPTDVQAVTVGGSSVSVTTTDIPSYQTEITPQLLATLDSRPTAATDFAGGQASVTAGQKVAFGQDVGYRTTNCLGQPGNGYWPPGPACATVQQHTFTLPLLPQPASSPQATGLGEIGLWVDGVSVFNWSDAMTYRNQGVWHRTAAVWEADSMDICGGHSANGDYHSHFYPICLAQQLGDNGRGASPIYGFAADGYPIYGPWLAAGVLARSGWVARDYDTPGSATGCGAQGARTCLLVDPTNPANGAKPTSQAGPTTSAIIAGFPGHNVQTSTGAFLEDFYYDRSCTQCLDEHNGIDDHDGRGYHYVITVTQAADGSLVPAFPYVVGPTFAGTVSRNWASFPRSGQPLPPPPGRMR